MLDKIRHYLKPNIKLEEVAKHRKVILYFLAFVLLIVVLARFGLSSYRSYNEALQDKIDMAKIRYEKLSKLEANKDYYTSLNQELKKLKQEKIQDDLIHADTPALSEAKFQNIINELAKNNQLNVLSMRVMSATQGKYVRTIKLGINCRAEITAIKNFMQGVYEHPKFLFFDQVEIKIVNRRERRYYNFNARLSAWTKV